MQAFSVFFLKPYLHIKLSLFFNSLMLYLAVQVPHFHTKLAHFPRLSSPSFKCLHSLYPSHFIKRSVLSTGSSAALNHAKIVASTSDSFKQDQRATVVRGNVQQD